MKQLTKSIFVFVPALVLAANLALGSEGPIFRELTTQGVSMSDGTTIKLPPPILADGLDAAGQKAALAKADARTSVDELVRKSYYAPSVVKVRTVKAAKDEGPAVRAVDIWFVVHGDWDMLTSQDFLESLAKGSDEGKSSVVTKSGVLTDEEMAKRKLSVETKEGHEERFVYATFALFERVQLSATRHSETNRGDASILVAGKIDAQFDADADYPNQWRPLLRNEQAEIVIGDPHTYHNAGGYAKITRLLNPADAALIEFHLVYEEPYGWFDGANLVKQKASLIVQEKVRTFRRKLALAAEKTDKKPTP